MKAKDWLEVISAFVISALCISIEGAAFCLYWNSIVSAALHSPKVAFLDALAILWMTAFFIGVYSAIAKAVRL